MSRRNPRRGYRAALLVTVIVGFALRLPLLDAFPLREDEAIYAYWALHGWHVDPLFLQVWPDKPPIFLWLLALGLEAWGTAASSARVINIGFSTLTIPVVAVTARRWWGDLAGVAAAVLMALSPFALSFAPTAFTDPLLVLAGALALCLAARRRWFWSGVWLGVAIMTKQQGLLFVPLVLAAAGLSYTAHLTQRRRDAEGISAHVQNSSFAVHNSQLVSSSAAFLFGVLAITLPVLYWDSLRWSVAPSPWDLGARNAGSIAISAPALWLSRLQAWSGQAWYLAASWPAWLTFTAAMIGAVLVRKPLPRPPQFGGEAVASVGAVAPQRTDSTFLSASVTHSPNWLRSGQSAPALMLLLWTLFFLAVHVATNVQVWDRYLLPLVIPLALLGGWAAARLGAAFRALNMPPVVQTGIVLFSTGLFLAILAPPALQAAGGEFPIGGDHGDYAGLDAAFAYVRDVSERQPVVLYHRELGWHARFYLFDAIRQGSVELRYFPHGVYLADSATKFPHKGQFVIVPDWAPIRDLPWQLASRGLEAAERLRAGRFTVLEIHPRTGGDASWQVCRPARPARLPWPALTGARAGDMMCRQ